MTIDEIIRSLEDQAKDRDSSVDEDDPDCIFRRDAKALREAASLLTELAEYRKTGLTATEYDERFDMLRQLVISAVYEETLEGGIGLKVFTAIKSRVNQRFENYRVNGGKCPEQRDRPKTASGELLDFCARREVLIYTTYDFITDSLIIVMRKKDRRTKISISRDIVYSAGFELTIRVILRRMADELDKEVQA